LVDTSAPLTNALDFASKIGFFNTIIPFVLVFALVYGILRYSKILGDPDEKRTNAINVVIAFAISFLVIATTNIVQMINAFVPNTALLLVIALMVLLLLGFAGFKTQNYLGEQKKGAKFIAVILVIIFVGVLFYSFGWNILSYVNIDPSSVKDVFTAEVVNLMIGLALLIGIPLLVVVYVAKAKKD